MALSGVFCNLSLRSKQGLMAVDFAASVVEVGRTRWEMGLRCLAGENVWGLLESDLA
jgi:hypothetical protein